MLCRSGFLQQRQTILQLSRIFESTASFTDAEAPPAAKAGPATNANKVVAAQTLSAAEIWKRREKLAKPTIQRDEVLAPKVYYAPEWEPASDDPIKKYGTTPEKWEYYNKVVWPPNYIVPETGLPKAREVFHCRESVHYSPKKMWNVCQMVRRMKVNDAIDQLKYKEAKGSLMLAEVIEEAMARARDEFHILQPEKMFVAEAFPIQCKMLKGRRRHARENWNTIRYRYINIFVRLEEGVGPSHKKRVHDADNWELMESYYKYLRNRDVKYSL